MRADEIEIAMRTIRRAASHHGNGLDCPGCKAELAAGDLVGALVLAEASQIYLRATIRHSLANGKMGKQTRRRLKEALRNS